MVNFETTDLASRLGTNGLVKQYYVSKVATTTLVKCMKNWNICDVLSSYISWDNLFSILCNFANFHCLKDDFVQYKLKFPYFTARDFFTDAIGSSIANFSEIWTKNDKQKSVNKMHVEKQYNNVGHFGPQCV